MMSNFRSWTCGYFPDSKERSISFLIHRRNGSQDWFQWTVHCKDWLASSLRSDQPQWKGENGSKLGSEWNTLAKGIPYSYFNAKQLLNLSTFCVSIRICFLGRGNRFTEYGNRISPVSEARWRSVRKKTSTEKQEVLLWEARCFCSKCICLVASFRQNQANLWSIPTGCVTRQSRLQRHRIIHCLSIASAERIPRRKSSSASSVDASRFPV